MRARQHLTTIAVLAILCLGPVHPVWSGVGSGSDVSARPPTWLPAAVGDRAITVYRVAGSTLPRYRVWDGTTFGAAQF